MEKKGQATAEGMPGMLPLVPEHDKTRTREGCCGDQRDLVMAPRVLEALRITCVAELQPISFPAAADVKGTEHVETAVDAKGTCQAEQH